MLPVSSGASVWRSCGCLTKRSKLYYAEGTPSDSNNPGEKSTIEVKNKQRISTTFLFTPCWAHTAVLNTYPSSRECLCYSAVLSTKSAALLYKCSFTLYRLTPLGFHGATVSFYLNDTPNILKVRFQRPGVSTPTDNTENLNKIKQNKNHPYTFTFSSFDFLHERCLLTPPSLVDELHCMCLRHNDLHRNTVVKISLCYCY